MNFWHRVAHLFGLNDWYRELTVSDGNVVLRDHCDDCDRVRRTIVLFPDPEPDARLMDLYLRVKNKIDAP